MRTTITLDPDVQLLVTRTMKERGVTFKQAVNDAIRTGASSPRRRRQAPFPTFDMGDAFVDVTKALQIADQLEDDERARRLSTGT